MTTQTPDASADEDPVCTGCGGTGISYQTERRCACKPPPVFAHHNRHPWAQPGDEPDRWWILRFSDPDMREMLWNGPDAEQEAREAYAKYCPAWSVYLFSAVDLSPAPAQGDVAGLVEKWGQDARDIDGAHGTYLGGLAEGYRRCLDELAAALLMPAAHAPETCATCGYWFVGDEHPKGCPKCSGEWPSALAAPPSPSKADVPKLLHGILAFDDPPRLEYVAWDAPVVHRTITPSFDLLLDVETREPVGFTFYGKWPNPDIAELVEAAKAVTFAAWTDRFGRLHGHATVVALEAALASFTASHDAADRCPKCGGTHSGRYEGACAGPPTPSAPPPHKMMG